MNEIKEGKMKQELEALDSELYEAITKRLHSKRKPPRFIQI